jgi:hypothetical protein
MLFTAALSIAGHAAVLLALATLRSDPPTPLNMQFMNVVLLEAPPPVDAVKPQEPARQSADKPPKRRDIFRETPKPPPKAVEPRPAGKAKTPAPGVEVSDSELAGAATAGSGPAGGACNMARWLQTKLRQDRRVQAVVAQSNKGKALMIWNGDWVQHPGQEGQGLAAVRETLMWEIAFAPEGCRADPVHGLVVISLGDGAGGGRLVLGTSQWKWSDLLFHKQPAVATTTAQR